MKRTSSKSQWKKKKKRSRADLLVRLEFPNFWNRSSPLRTLQIHPCDSFMISRICSALSFISSTALFFKHFLIPHFYFSVKNNNLNWGLIATAKLISLNLSTKKSRIVYRNANDIFNVQYPGTKEVKKFNFDVKGRLLIFFFF